jgi:molecular chaperone DnaK (HSP70)
MSIVGFDLGTSNCRISCWWGTHKPEIIYEMPTVISFTENKEILVGQEALKLGAEKYPTNTIYDTKRILGTHFGGETEREKKEFLTYETVWPFHVESSKSSTYQYVLKVKEKEERMTTEEVLSKILNHLKEKTEELLGIQNLKDIVVTIPGK